jgi:hypothetical protein
MRANLINKYTKNVRLQAEPKHLIQGYGNNTKLQEGSLALRPNTEEWLLQESGADYNVLARFIAQHQDLFTDEFYINYT